MAAAMKPRKLGKKSPAGASKSSTVKKKPKPDPKPTPKPKPRPYGCCAIKRLGG